MTTLLDVIRFRINALAEGHAQLAGKLAEIAPLVQETNGAVQETLRSMEQSLDVTETIYIKRLASNA